MKLLFPQDMTPFSLVEARPYQSYTGTCCLHHQGALYILTMHHANCFRKLTTMTA
jgi:hypothetical protein